MDNNEKELIAKVSRMTEEIQKDLKTKSDREVLETFYYNMILVTEKIKQDLRLIKENLGIE